MTPSLDDVVNAAEKAIRLPRSATHIYDLASNPDTQIGELVSAVEVDPAFAAQMLRLANSAVYSPTSSIADLDAAIVRIGHRETAQLAIAMAAGSEFSALENELLQLTSFWKHSLTTAVLAKKFLKLFNLPVEGAFCAGLLHDLGLMVMFYTESSVMLDVLDQSLDSEYEDLVAAEKRVLGFDHTEVGSRIAENWGLPNVIIEAIRHHHCPARASEHSEVVHAIALANAMESVHASNSPDLFTDISRSIQDQVASMFDFQTIVPVHAELIQESEVEAAELSLLF